MSPVWTGPFFQSFRMCVRGGFSPNVAVAWYVDDGWCSTPAPHVTFPGPTLSASIRLSNKQLPPQRTSLCCSLTASVRILLLLDAREHVWEWGGGGEKPFQSRKNRFLRETIRYYLGLFVCLVKLLLSCFLVLKIGEYAATLSYPCLLVADFNAEVCSHLDFLSFCDRTRISLPTKIV